jgi:hypothetical protein
MKQWSAWHWAGIGGAAISIVAAVVSWVGTIQTARINKEATQAAQINKEAAEKVARALDFKIIDWAMIVMQDPDSTVAQRGWALGILSAWRNVPLSSDRRREIARSGKTLVETGRFIPEAKVLNDKLNDIPFWQYLASSEQRVDIRPSLKVDKAPLPKAEQLPARGE